ncbi:MAG: DUF4446 family protein [Patescibacteria group bacterium]
MLLAPPSVLIIGGVFALWLAGITFWIFKIASHYNNLVKRSDKKTLTDILKSILDCAKTNESKIDLVDKKLDALEKRVEGHIQKLGVVRFNPYGDTGGNQSFAVALLNSKNTGMVILSLHGREGTRVYTKTVVNGKSAQDLSYEEKQAIEQAK